MFGELYVWFFCCVIEEEGLRLHFDKFGFGLLLQIGVCVFAD